MLGDFWGPYFVTIAGVATTAILGYVLRFAWRWCTAPLPILVHLELLAHGVTIRNVGDFTIHVLSVEAPPPAEAAWRYAFPTPRRIAPNQWIRLFSEEDFPAMRLDRPYHVVLRDDHHVRWDATYHGTLGAHEGHTLMEPALRRFWPAPINWLLVQAQLTWRLVRFRKARS
jgi:hypothetical protein